MDDMRMDMKEFSDKFCEQDHRTKDTETIWNEFKDALVKSADKHIPRKNSWFNLKIVDKILIGGHY
jgi:hypothetical protein